VTLTFCRFEDWFGAGEGGLILLLLPTLCLGVSEMVEGGDDGVFSIELITGVAFDGCGLLALEKVLLIEEAMNEKEKKK